MPDLRCWHWQDLSRKSRILAIMIWETGSVNVCAFFLLRPSLWQRTLTKPYINFGRPVHPPKRAWTEASASQSTVNTSSRTLMLFFCTPSSHYCQQEQQNRIFVDGQHPSRWFPLPLPIYRMQNYWSRINGKTLPSQSSLSSPRLSSSRLCSSKTGLQRRSGSRYNCHAVTMC